MPPIRERTARMPSADEQSRQERSAQGTRMPVTKRLASLLAIPVLVVALAACQGNTGISSEDAAAIRDQIQQVADRLDAVEDRLIDLSQATNDAPAQLISEVRAATSDVGEAKTMLADVSDQLDASVPDTTVEDAIDQTDDFLDDTLPDSDTVDPFLDPAPTDELPPADQTPFDDTPGLDTGPEAPDPSPFGNDQQ